MSHFDSPRIRSPMALRGKQRSKERNNYVQVQRGRGDNGKHVWPASPTFHWEINARKKKNVWPFIDSRRRRSCSLWRKMTVTLKMARRRWEKVEEVGGGDE